MSTKRKPITAKTPASQQQREQKVDALNAGIDMIARGAVEKKTAAPAVNKGGRPPKYQDAKRRTIVLPGPLDDQIVELAERRFAGNVSAALVALLEKALEGDVP